VTKNANTAKQTPFTKRIDSRVLAFARRLKVLGEKERVVVGISGGPDSTALLVILARLRGQLGLRVSAAHFDHMLRTRAEAAADLDYCRALCRMLRVPLAAGRGSVRVRVKRYGETTEEAARKLRFAFLGREARSRKATVVILGHTLDDRAETVLLNVIRGAGLEGIAAMPARAPWPFGEGPDVARPLLELSRKDTERYCRESGFDPREDPTNEMLIATRNRVRHELMPLLRSFNPRIDRALVRLAETGARDSAFVQGAAAAEWERLACHGPGVVSFDRDELRALAPALAARLLRRACQHLGGSPESDRIDELLAVLPRGRTAIDLAGNVTAQIKGDQVTLSTSR
jgi:tRNA(Ile)-lysidine synthase